MSKEIELLTEIRDLLQVVAEPALAKRDEKFREAVRTVVGKGQKKRDAIMLMDGSRTESVIAKEASIDPGQLNRLVKALKAALLVGQDGKHPKLHVKLPSNFFGDEGNSNE
jgi:hypothetical protein